MQAISRGAGTGVAVAARMKRTLSIACSFLGLSVSICASASARSRAALDPGATTRVGAPGSDWTLQGGEGMFVDPHEGIGFTLGGLGLYRSGPIDVGAAGELGTQLVGYSYAGVAGAVGLGVRTSSDLRFDALVLAGSHSYTGVGTKLFSADPGAGGAFPFVGGRLLASYPLFHGPHHLTLGVEGSYEDDLGRRHVSYDYQETSFLGGDPYTEHADHVVGMQRVGVSVQIGGSFDVR